MKKLLLVFALCLISNPVWATVYHVDQTGGAANLAACAGADPGNGSRCSMTQGNGASAGDVVNLYDDGGAITTMLAPSNSGSVGNVITFQKAVGETPVITVAAGRGFSISGNKDYIKLDGITFQNCAAWGQIANGSDYNEIANCTFTSTGWVNGNKGIYIWTAGGSVSTHNWIYGNTFSRNAVEITEPTCGDEGGHLWLGVYGYGTADNNNTVEDNVFAGGGHHLMETYSKYNVVRNNVFHNEGFIDDVYSCTWGPSPRNSKYGNRNLQIYDGGSNTGMFNLVEGNRTGHAAFAVGETEGAQDGNLTITAPKNIVRYNDSYYSETWGIYFKTGTGSIGANNRVYNNTLFNNGQDSAIYPDAWTGYGNLDWRKSIGESCSGNACTGNIIKNNIIYGGFTADISDDTNTYTNNFCTNAGSGCSANGDPDFTDTDTSDPTSLTLPDLTIQSSSPAIDAGTYLTQAYGSGTNSTTLVVDDALYFQDGSWGSALASHVADWIAVGNVNNTVQISSINYATNTITLASSISWSDNDSVWLYKDSDGTIVLYGNAPDAGAHEYNAGEDSTDPTVTAFVIPATSESLTISITTFTCTDAVGVTGYKVTESAVPPGAGDPGWTASAPANYTVGDYGEYTFYAWCKDAAGNVSDSLNDTVTVSQIPGSVTGVGVKFDLGGATVRHQ